MCASPSSRFISLLALAALTACGTEASTPSIDHFISTAHGLSVIERDEAPEGYRVFDITVEQEVAPGHGDGIYQQHGIWFAHEENPYDMVLVTNGYSLAEGAELESVATLLGTSQLALEYRYNGESVPADDPLYEHMRSEFGATDLHRAVELFRQRYAGAWISTGSSRGGTVALTHRALFPDDMDASVVYGTPDTDAGEDLRWGPALAAWGPTPCREALFAVQHAMLGEHREAMVQKFAELQEGDQPWGFEIVGGPAAAMQATVLDLSLTFWQYYTWPYTCDDVPDATAATADDLFTFLIDVDGGLASDAAQAYFRSFYVIAQRQEGYPRLPTAHLDGLLEEPIISLEKGHLPPEIPVEVDGRIDETLDLWVENDAEHVMFIDGEMDSWAANVQKASPLRDVVRYVVPGAGHFGAAIEGLDPLVQHEVSARLRDWAHR